MDFSVTASALTLSSSEGPEGGGGGAASRRGAWRIRAIDGNLDEPVARLGSAPNLGSVLHGEQSS